MHPNYLVAEYENEYGGKAWELNRELVQKIIDATTERPSDIDSLDGVVRLLRREIDEYSQRSWSSLLDEDLDLLNKAYRILCARIGVQSSRLPFRDWTEYQRWRRREQWDHYRQLQSSHTEEVYWDDFFGDLEEHVSSVLEASWTQEVLRAVSPHEETGWESVDTEIDELRRKFSVARTASDHSGVGHQCVRVIEKLAAVAYDLDVHGKSAQGEPKPAETKNRFEAIIHTHTAGKENELLRKLSKDIVALAQEVKHRHTPNREDAGIAADSVIFLANLIRRLSYRPVRRQVEQCL